MLDSFDIFIDRFENFLHSIISVLLIGTFIRIIIDLI